MPPLYEWDEAKRERNVRKHGLDFADAWRVHEAPDRMTIDAVRAGESRKIDVAVLGDDRLVLTFVYALRGRTVRCISLRRASRAERSMYDAWQAE